MASKNPVLLHAVVDVANASKNPAAEATLAAARANLVAAQDPSAKATLAAAKANMAAAQIEDFITKSLANSPPIGAETRQRLARLLTVEEK